VLIGVMTPQLAQPVRRRHATAKSFAKTKRGSTPRRQLATMWPIHVDPTVAEAKSMVATLFTLEYLQLADWSIAAPRRPHERDLRRRCGRPEAVRRPCSLVPVSMPRTAPRRSWLYGPDREVGAHREDVLASEASVLVGYCRNFNEPATWTQSPLERRTAHRPSCAPTIPRR